MTNTEKAVQIFQKLDKDHMSLVKEFYDTDVVFTDPVHSLKGSQAVEDYYKKLYKEVKSIRFEFSQVLSQGDTTVLVWKMFLAAPNLNGGNEFSVDGTSLIRFGGREGKAIYHRDYFDMGEFVYERVPILKSLIKLIKEKLAG